MSITQMRSCLASKDVKFSEQIGDCKNRPTKIFKVISSRKLEMPWQRFPYDENFHCDLSKNSNGKILLLFSFDAVLS